MSLDLRVDPDREGRLHAATGIYVRATHADRWGTFDIAELDQPSLNAFLRSRGGDNPWAESVVEILLGHVPLADRP
jgi:hypothetical protein